MKVRISGLVYHGQAEGDGIVARIVSSRLGVLGSWNVHNDRAEADIDTLSVETGDTIDFVVDPLGSDGYDGYGWAPLIQTKDGVRKWDAKADFGHSTAMSITRLALYVQALMMTNEFLFVD
jgi:hypothetical protein